MRAGLINIAIGLLAIIVGAGVSIWSYQSVQQGGGHYFVYWGIVLVGAWRLLLGIFQLLRAGASKEGRQTLWHIIWPSSLIGALIRLGVIAALLGVFWVVAPDEWKSFSPKPARTFHATDDVESLAITKDGKWIAAGTSYGGLELWNLVTGEKGQLPEPESYLDINSIAFSPDGSLLAAATASGLRIWTCSAWGTAEPTLLRKAERGSYSIAFSPDGKSIATGSIGHGAIVFDAQTGAINWQTNGSDSILAVAYSRDGRFVASAESGGSIKLWDAQSGTLMRTLNSDQWSEQATTLAFFKDGRLAVGSYQKPGIQIFDINSGTLLRTLKGSASMLWQPKSVWSIAISPDETWIAAGQNDRSLRFWKPDNDLPVKSLFGHQKDVMSVAFVPGAHDVVSGGADKALNVWANEP